MIYSETEMIDSSDLPPSIWDFAKSSKKYLFFKTKYNGDLLFDTIYIILLISNVEYKYKSPEIHLFKRDNEVYVSDQYYDDEFSIDAKDYRNHRVRINTMKMVNKAIKAYVNDIYKSFQEHMERLNAPTVN